MVGQVCSRLPEDANRCLLAAIIRLLCPGGRIGIIDVVPNERGDGPDPALQHAFGLSAAGDRGFLYPFSADGGWLLEAGFRRAEPHPISAVPPVTLISACRPWPRGPG